MDTQNADTPSPLIEPDDFGSEDAHGADNTSVHNAIAEFPSQDDSDCIEILNWKANALRQINGDGYEKILPVLLKERQSNPKCNGVAVTNETVQAIALLQSKLPRNKPSTDKAALKNRSMTHRELKEVVKSAPGEIVEHLIPEKSVNLFAGDSGLGKTPLLVQLGLCVASGHPFLGFKVRQGNVLYVDYENGQVGFEKLLERLGTFMQLDSIPEEFHVLQLPESLNEVAREIQTFRPKLVIIDSVRGLDSKAETENQNAGELLKKLHQIAAANGTSFVLVHHLRKPDRKNPPGRLAETPIMQWLEQVSGARALVNQSDVRIGCERGDEDVLVLKGHYKLVGEFGSHQIVRVLDENGVPLGYKVRVGLALLSPDDRIRFAELPAGEFTFTQAQDLYDKKKAGRPTAEFLKRCQNAGLLSKAGSGKQTRYEKITEATGAPEGQNVTE
jgi:hypothetical protein